jgi:hypothetical protein
MAYGVGGILFLLCVVGYAAVETRLELRHDQQQMAEAETSSGVDHARMLSQ